MNDPATRLAVEVTVWRNAIAEAVRELHEAAGLDMAGAKPRLVYLPGWTGFGMVRPRSGFAELLAPRAADRSIVGPDGLLGFPVGWLGDYWGWLPFPATRVEFMEHHETFHVYLAHDSAVGDGSHEEAVLRMVAVLLKFGRSSRALTLTPRAEVAFVFDTVDPQEAPANKLGGA